MFFYPLRSTIAKEQTEQYFREEAASFYKASIHLSQTLRDIDSTSPATIDTAKAALIYCRLHYKRISFLLDYFFPSQALIYNAPAKFETEEPYAEYESPHGLQQVEALLFEKDPAAFKKDVFKQGIALAESASDLGSLLYQWEPTESQVMQSIRLELIRVMTLYIEGYDAQFLKSGIRESAEALTALKKIFSFYKNDPDRYQQTIASFDAATEYLTNHTDFERFDRLFFIRQYMIALERECNATSASKNALPVPGIFDGFTNQLASHDSPEMIALGRQLFFEARLSGNNTRSCSSCHNPSLYFTDGLAKNSSIDHSITLNRNTPTLLYTANQSRQFWDGRAKTLDEQVKTVLSSTTEMNATVSTIEEKINSDHTWKKKFAIAFAKNPSKKITVNEVCHALAAFLRSLSPMNSPFDRYIRGDEQALTSAQQRGFNLFTGKAQCATCHFLPYYNGLIPPLYTRSEFEVIGVPQAGDLKKPLPDEDAGYFDVLPLPFNYGAFKTPTVRNIGQTPPYMHNGSFDSLADVIRFYNKGGGRGIGLSEANQTLSDKPLNLSAEEETDIISFLQALTDDASAIQQKLHPAPEMAARRYKP